MEFAKYRRTMMKKYYYDIDKHLEAIDSYNDVQSDYWDIISGNLRANIDNKPNIRKWNKDKNAYDFYALNSKHWTLVDPEVKDIKSIQYARNNLFNFSDESNLHVDEKQKERRI